MDQVIPNLWIGSMQSALDVETLKSNNIHSVLSAMRGRVLINETFTRRQIDLDDTDEEDVLVHLVPCISFIQAELEQERGVLVHCVAGISRSATIVAAYLMYSRDLDAQSAIDLIRTVRPAIQPNDGFIAQLDIFHQASFKVTRGDKATRMFYLERAVNEIMTGDGSDLQTDMFARFPRTPTDSAPATPGGGPRRRIRCRACRQELAARDHMLDHGQLGPPTPASARLLSPASSRRPSFKDQLEPISRQTSTGEHVTVTVSRRTSQPGSFTGSRPRKSSILTLSDSLSMSALETDEEDEGIPEVKEASKERPSLAGTGFAHANDLTAALYANPKLAGLRSPMGLSMTPLQPLLKPMTPTLPPLLSNPKCSGYFVEPMKWMEPFLENLEMEGKIICPNKKCGAKLGNYDWAGVCCSCKEWVVPGFCIARSKVDEIVS